MSAAPSDPSPGPPRRRPTLGRLAGIGFGLALLLALELLLRILPWQPMSRVEWNRAHGVVGIERFYPQRDSFFVEAQPRDGVPWCTPAPDLCPHPDSDHNRDNGVHWAEFPCAKPEGSLRIVTLGGSAAAGWGVPTGASFSEQLQRRLAGRSGQPVQVINAAISGYTSVQIRQMLPHIPSLDPDLVLLYAGHNDYNYFLVADAAELTPRWVRGLRSWGDQLVGWRWLRQAMYALHPPAGTPAEPRPIGRPGGARAADPQQPEEPRAVPATRAERLALAERERRSRSLIDARFEDNLRAIERWAQRHDARLVVMAPVSRLDERPLDSIHWRDLDDQALASFQHSWAVLRGGPGNLEADSAQQQALAVDDSYAALRHLAGERALAAGQDELAVEHFRAAADHTPPSRCPKAPPRHAQVARHIAASLDAPFLDLWPIFAQAAQRPGLPPEDLLLDSVHPNPAGHALIADTLAAFLVDEALLP